MDKPTDKQTIKSATSNQPSKRPGRKLRREIVSRFKVSKFILHNNCCLFNFYNSVKWQFGHCRSRINTKKDNEKAKDDESLKRVNNKVADKVKSLAEHEGNYDQEMNGDDGIGPDMPLTDLAENRNGHIGQLRLGYWEQFSFSFVLSVQICLRLRWKERTRRADWSRGSLLPGTNSTHQVWPHSWRGRRPRRKKETGGGPWRFTLKTKLETSTSMSCRENYVGLTPPFSDHNRTDDDIFSARRRHLWGRTPSLLCQNLHSTETNGEIDH